MNLNVCFLSIRHLYVNILYPENTFRTQTLFKEQARKKQYISKEKVLSFFFLNTELLTTKDFYCSENSCNIFTHVKEVPHNPPNLPSHTMIWTKQCVLYYIWKSILEGELRMISLAVATMLHLPIFR